jgi:hypothetical protein
LCAFVCVCVSWFKEIGGLHSVRRSQVPTSKNILTIEEWLEKFLEHILFEKLAWVHYLKIRFGTHKVSMDLDVGGVDLMVCDGMIKKLHLLLGD